MTMGITSTLVFVPDYTGAPWHLDRLIHVSERPQRTMRLPDIGENIEAYADFIEMKTVDVDQFVLVGDGFGAAVAVALAVRQPERLSGLVLTGGLTLSPFTDKAIRLLINSARRTPKPFYKSWFIRRVTQSLVSPYDYFGDAPWNEQMTRRLYEVNTTRRSVIHRLRAMLSAKHADLLSSITVPTLVLAPEHNPLFGNQPARLILDRIPLAEGWIVRRTGPMLRYTHPVLLSRLVRRFLVQRIDPIRDEVIERWYARYSVHRGLVGTSTRARLTAGFGAPSLRRSPLRMWGEYSGDAEPARVPVGKNIELNRLYR